jgi:23S rRNA pseudouridine955/2504/2580 synthase/23S rRNA pseudouridine1911/1915/1917 synthase
LKKKQLEIIYEDKELVIINKPALLLTVPDRYSPEKPNLLTMLNKKYGKIFIVHRLDKETSGILLFAKNAEAHRTMSMDFEHRRVKKTYLALVEGRMVQQEGLIDKPLAPSMTKYNKMVINKRGKASKTTFKVLESFKYYTLVEADIHSGRLHQIRVHLASIGYPLAIDFLYGNKGEFKLSFIKKKRLNLPKHEEERPIMTRTTLHAYTLTIAHPTTKEEMTFKADLPKDFRAVLNQLRKWNAI